MKNKDTKTPKKKEEKKMKKMNELIVFKKERYNF